MTKTGLNVLSGFSRLSILFALLFNHILPFYFPFPLACLLHSLTLFLSPFLLFRHFSLLSAVLHKIFFFHSVISLLFSLSFVSFFTFCLPVSLCASFLLFLILCSLCFFLSLFLLSSFLNFKFTVFIPHPSFPHSLSFNLFSSLTHPFTVLFPLTLPFPPLPPSFHFYQLSYISFTLKMLALCPN